MLVGKMEGQEAARNYLRFTRGEMLREAEGGLEVVIAKAEIYAKLYVAFLTGTLRRSINHRKTGVLEYELYTRVHYGPYQEFGTSKMKAHPFIRPAIKQITPEARMVLSVALARALNRRSI